MLQDGSTNLIHVLWILMSLVRGRMPLLMLNMPFLSTFSILCAASGDVRTSHINFAHASLRQKSNISWSQAGGILAYAGFDN
jgi:hypothetical protein